MWINNKFVKFFLSYYKYVQFWLNLKSYWIEKFLDFFRILWIWKNILIKLWIRGKGYLFQVLLWFMRHTIIIALKDYRLFMIFLNQFILGVFTTVLLIILKPRKLLIFSMTQWPSYLWMCTAKCPWTGSLSLWLINTSWLICYLGLAVSIYLNTILILHWQKYWESIPEHSLSITLSPSREI